MASEFDHKETLKSYILYPEISIHSPDSEIKPRKLSADRLYHIPKCPASTKLTSKRDCLSGNIIEFIEVVIQEAGASADNSMSMLRLPGLIEDGPRGSTLNFPFWPAGFENMSTQINNIDLHEIEIGSSEILFVPPGFSQGHHFANSRESMPTSKNVKINLLETLENIVDVQEWLKLKDLQHKLTTDVILSNVKGSLDENMLDVDFKPVLEISKTITNRFNKSEWAEMVDISHPVTNFKEKIPEPALSYPFELDIFQKQAILKLEERQYVFVAAHTSAGKTVVAEYAIALSQKHMTRAIYTSPIKALSNQKYRGFFVAYLQNI